jgi:hypothetical protein
LVFFHISSRYLDFRPVLGTLAEDLKLACISFNDIATDSAAQEAGKYSAHWVVLARRAEDLGPLLADSRWQPVAPRAGMRAWTDDYSNLLSIFEWR